MVANDSGGPLQKLCTEQTCMCKLVHISIPRVFMSPKSARAVVQRLLNDRRRNAS